MSLLLNILSPVTFLISTFFSISLYGAQHFVSKIDAHITQPSDSLKKIASQKKQKIEEIEVKVFYNKNYNKAITGFGYDIIISGSLYIHQPNIPSMPGNAGFSTKKKAKKTAKFIVQKIRNNIIPPTISRQELDSLNTLK